MRIALIGSNGQLGRDLLAQLAEHELFPLTRQEFDITDHARARSVISALKPDLLLNTTAYNRVDDCETHAELAYSVNALAALNFVRIANDLDATLVHFSTDYVFDGKSESPYTEDSIALPLSIYGNSKLAGEMLVRTMARKYFVIRTCGLYGLAGSRGKGGNFVETILSKARNGEPIRVVNDQTLTPTSTLEVARQLAVLLPTTHYGLFHMTCEAACSWYEFASAIFELSGITADLSPTSSDLYRAPALRPRYSVLENARLKKLGLNHMRHWREGLSDYLNSKTSVSSFGG
jgi:dTDP-4-dehydrorhamnose reductase